MLHEHFKIALLDLVAAVEGKLFLSTPYDHVIALNPVTGKKIWEFDPKLDLTHGYSEVTRAEFPHGTIRQPSQTRRARCGFLSARWMRG